MSASSAPASVINVDEVLSERRLSAFTALLVAILSIALITDGFDVVVLGVLAPAVSAEFGLSRIEIGWFLTLAHVGVAVGGIIGGLTGDRFGRRLVLLVSVAGFGIGTLACAALSDPLSFVIARFVASIFMGAAAPNIATYLVEILPRQLNSRLSVLAYAAYALGSLLCSLAARALLPIADWRVIFAIGGAVPLLLLTPLLFWLLPESPRFLVIAGRPSEEIAGTMRRLCGDSVAFVRNARFILNTSAHDGAAPKSFVATARAHVRSVATLSLFALLVYFTSISMSSMSTTILTSIGLPLTDAVSILLALNVGGLIGALLAAFTIERFGSKPTLLALLTCAVICLGILSFVSADAETAQVPILTVLYALAGFGLTSALMILYPLSAQAFPTQVRSTLTGGIASVGRIGSIASSAVVAMLLVAGGAMTAFAGVTAATAVAIVAVLAFNRHMRPVDARQ